MSYQKNSVYINKNLDIEFNDSLVAESEPSSEEDEDEDVKKIRNQFPEFLKNDDGKANAEESEFFDSSIEINPEEDELDDTITQPTKR